MSDEADNAAAYEETLRAAEILNATKHSGPVAKYTGFCLSCAMPIAEHGRRWCDAGCRDDWEKTKR